ncbi:unnamed protein product [Notodromas monacha]|uniref:NAD(+) kinase n=1 Tax=Notodromas monacha TaxID=399045 RepID=A0A7R9GAM5_9CRUS|nr:unnamed protein product [Notodromas monacha]CAG0914149.1 unnamed protein product [Notodromas monacha]
MGFSTPSLRGLCKVVSLYQLRSVVIDVKGKNISSRQRMMAMSVSEESGNQGSSARAGIHSYHSLGDPRNFDLKRVLVLSKISHYDFEKLLNPHMTDDELHENLKRRGTNVDGLQLRHNIHRDCTNLVVEAFRKRGVDTRVVDRFSYNQTAISWADLVVSTGGDGTFLLAASKIQDCNKPLVGVNSEPSKSEGHLCLPKKYRVKIAQAVDKIIRGKFQWMFRKRIRVTVSGKDVNSPPIELHAQRLNCYELRFFEDLPYCLEPMKLDELDLKTDEDVRVLPVLALNEVFIGESLSARVSYCELSIDDGQWFKQKSSGFIFSTGSGSTSWTFNISKLNQQTVKSLLKIISEEAKLDVDAESLQTNHELIERITARFNNGLILTPDQPHIVYTIRDPISPGVLPSSSDIKPRDLAAKVLVKSRCMDASLVIDGGLSFKFNNGTKARLELLDHDALRTMVLDESSEDLNDEITDNSKMENRQHCVCQGSEHHGITLKDLKLGEACLILDASEAPISEKMSFLSQSQECEGLSFWPERLLPFEIQCYAMRSDCFCRGSGEHLPP